MARVTQVQPWGFGGKQSGSFAGRVGLVRASVVSRPNVFGFGGKRYGSFAGRGAVRTVGQYTEHNPWGFGGKKYGPFTGRVTVDPTATVSGSFSLSGIVTSNLILNDDGGPYWEYGEFGLSGVGDAVVQLGVSSSDGSGSFSLYGTGDATAEDPIAAIVDGSGSGSFGLSGSGVAYGPEIDSLGLGDFGLSGSGLAEAVTTSIGDVTLGDIANAVLNSEIEPGISLRMVMRAVLAVMGGPAEMLATGSEERFNSPAGILRVKSRVDAAGNRLTELNLQ